MAAGVDLSTFDWFHGRVGKDHAEEILEKAPNGSFLVSRMFDCFIR